MKKIILSLSAAVFALCLASSCDDDENVVLSSDCYINSLTLGNVKRVISTVGSSGNDTTYTVSYSGLYYPMIVNQLEGTIANKDSLPVNSDVRAVLATVESSGTVVYRKENEGEDSWHSYSTSDSIDFTTPLIFRVYAPDNSASRDYRVQVNVHQQDGEVFVWEKMAEQQSWAAAEALKAVARNGQVWLYGQENGGARLFVTEASDGRNWSELAVAGCQNADVATLAELAGTLYMNTTDGALLKSTDGQNWDNVAAGRTLRLLTADGTNLYALSDGGIWRSADGQTWQEEALDDDASLLPAQDFAALAYAQENGVERVLLAGNRAWASYPADGAAVVWSRSTMPGQEAAGWTYFNVSPDNYYPCPRLKGLMLLHYGDVLLAVGRKSLDAVSHEAFDDMYVSQDNGITWKADGTYTLPEELAGQDVVSSAAVDGASYLWIVAGAQVWRGRLSELGFEAR